MDIYDRLMEITDRLEDAIAYGNWTDIHKIRDEILFIAEEITSDIPIDQDQDYYN